MKQMTRDMDGKIALLCVDTYDYRLTVEDLHELQVMASSNLMLQMPEEPLILLQSLARECGNRLREEDYSLFSEVLPILYCLRFFSERKENRYGVSKFELKLKENSKISFDGLLLLFLYAEWPEIAKHINSINMKSFLEEVKDRFVNKKIDCSELSELLGFSKGSIDLELANAILNSIGSICPEDYELLNPSIILYKDYAIHHFSLLKDEYLTQLLSIILESKDPITSISTYNRHYSERYWIKVMDQFKYEFSINKDRLSLLECQSLLSVDVFDYSFFNEENIIRPHFVKQYTNLFHFFSVRERTNDLETEAIQNIVNHPSIQFLNDYLSKDHDYEGVLVDCLIMASFIDYWLGTDDDVCYSVDLNFSVVEFLSQLDPSSFGVSNYGEVDIQMVFDTYNYLFWLQNGKVCDRSLCNFEFKRNCQSKFEEGLISPFKIGKREMYAMLDLFFENGLSHSIIFQEWSTFLLSAMTEVIPLFPKKEKYFDYYEGPCCLIYNAMNASEKESIEVFFNSLSKGKYLIDLYYWPDATLLLVRYFQLLMSGDNRKEILFQLFSNSVNEKLFEIEDRIKVISQYIDGKKSIEEVSKSWYCDTEELLRKLKFQFYLSHPLQSEDLNSNTPKSDCMRFCKERIDAIKSTLAYSNIYNANFNWAGDSGYEDECVIEDCIGIIRNNIYEEKKFFEHFENFINKLGEIGFIENRKEVLYEFAYRLIGLRGENDPRLNPGEKIPVSPRFGKATKRGEPKKGYLGLLYIVKKLYKKQSGGQRVKGMSGTGLYERLLQFFVVLDPIIQTQFEKSVHSTNPSTLADDAPIEIKDLVDNSFPSSLW